MLQCIACIANLIRDIKNRLSGVMRLLTSPCLFAP